MNERAALLSRIETWIAREPLFLRVAGIATLFYLLIVRSLIFESLYPDTSIPLGAAWIEIVLWMTLAALVSVAKANQEFPRRELQRLRAHPELLLFVFYSLASVTWSVDWETTLHRSLTMVGATVAGLYFATRCDREQFLRALFGAVATMVAASVILVVSRPELGTDLNPPYNGAWRGIFWHKNHLGTLLPVFGLVALYYWRPWARARRGSRAALAVPVLALIALAEWNAHSVTGYVVAFGLFVGLAAGGLLVRFRERVRSVHLYLAGLVAVIGMATISVRLDRVLGAFGRDPSLTGRVSLWTYLVENLLTWRPWYGAGFGTIWASEGFRTRTQKIVGWAYPVMIGDNGLIDITLNLGVIGLALFLVVFGRSFVQAGARFRADRSFGGLFGVLLLLYILLANLAFSLMLETELLIWFLLVVILVSDHASNREEPAQGQR